MELARVSQLARGRRLKSGALWVRLPPRAPGMKCGMAGLGCPRPDDPVDPDTDHLFVDYEVFSVYHRECCDNPADCSRPDEHEDVKFP